MSNKILKSWKIEPMLDNELLKNYQDYDAITAQLLFNRALIKQEQIISFLDPSYKYLENPFLFNNMQKAVELIIKHIKAGEKIFIYGDYDADGVTSSSLLQNILEIFHAKIAGVYLPDRVSEGYGLKKEAIDFIVNQGAKLIITVDTGIRNKEEVDYAKSCGLEVIITDHHVASSDKNDWPNCLIINPAIEDEAYPFKKLAGVGVAFKLAQALIQKSKLDDQMKERLEQSLLDLVAIGTIADCVPLLGENRILAKKGLEILAQTRRKGLIELMKISGIKENTELKAWNIGFQIAPRINAAGRMEHANGAYNLLIEKDLEKAKTLALALNQNNIERQQITEEIFAFVDKQVNEKDFIIIGLCDDYEGVVGLVAGKICEKYYRPTLVLTEIENGYKGSGRSIPSFNLIEAISECDELLDKYGGHPMACGFSLAKNNFESFKNKLQKIAEEKLKKEELIPQIKIDMELKLDEISLDLIEKLNKFEPFGQENVQPKFCSKNFLVQDILLMGMNGQHIKFRLQEKEKTISALAFNQAENFENIRIGDIIDVCYCLDVNEFNGSREVQMKIIDLKLVDKPASQTN